MASRRGDPFARWAGRGRRSGDLLSSFFLDDQNTTNLLRDFGLGGLGLHGGSRESQDHREKQNARRAGDDHPRVPLHHLDKAAAVVSPSHATVAAALLNQVFLALDPPPSHVSPQRFSTFPWKCPAPSRLTGWEHPLECGPGGDLTSFTIFDRTAESARSVTVDAKPPPSWRMMPPSRMAPSSPSPC